MSERKIEVALLDPKWEVGIVEIDGHQIPRLTIFHPQHGPIDCAIPRATAQLLAAGLVKATDLAK